MIKIENEERIIEYEYDYRGRLMGRIERELPDGENVETVRMSYSVVHQYWRRMKAIR